MPDAIASLDLVDCAGPVFEKAVGLGSDAIKVLGPVADRVVVDLDFKPCDYRLPRWVVRIERRLVCRTPLQCGGKIECWTGEADEDAAVLPRRIENLELQPQSEIAERFGGIVEQPQPSVTVADHFTIAVQHPSSAGPGETPSRKRGRGSVEECAETRLRLRTDDRVGAGKHARIQQVTGAAAKRHAREQRVRRPGGREE